MRISLDFDGTLSEENIQLLALKLVANNDIVYIVTARSITNYNKDLEAVADMVGIPMSRVHYTEGALKAETVKFLGIDIHYDNMAIEVDEINDHTNCLGILVNRTDD